MSEPEAVRPIAVRRCRLLSARNILSGRCVVTVRPAAVALRARMLRMTRRLVRVRHVRGGREQAALGQVRRLVRLDVRVMRKMSGGLLRYVVDRGTHDSLPSRGNNTN